MDPTRVKDNTKYEKGKEQIKPVQTLLAKVSNKTLEELSKENILIFPPIKSVRLSDDEISEDLSGKQHVLTSDKDHYYFENVMGFLGCKQERLIIESRFSVDNDGKNDFFFQYLLERVFRIPNIVDLNTSTDNQERLYDYLSLFFPYFLKQAMRKGIYKTYIRREYNDANIHGIIDVTRHIRDNTPFVGKIAYNQREHSYDNYITELIRHTIEYIRGKSYGNSLLKAVRDEVGEIINVTNEYRLSDRRKIIDRNKKNIVNHAFYYEYQKLQRLCIFILENQKIRVGLGTSNIHGILFDGAWLWEEYINTVFERAMLDSLYHPKNKADKGAEYLFANQRGKIFPDFVCRYQDKLVIADAKYKPIQNISGRDYQQILAYMFRFDAKRGFFIYPSTQNDKEKNIKLFLNSGLACEGTVNKRENIYVIKYGFKIPDDAKEYPEFVVKMKKHEDYYIEHFKELFE